MVIGVLAAVKIDRVSCHPIAIEQRQFVAPGEVERLHFSIFHAQGPCLIRGIGGDFIDLRRGCQLSGVVLTVDFTKNGCAALHPLIVRLQNDRIHVILHVVFKVPTAGMTCPSDDIVTLGVVTVVVFKANIFATLIGRESVSEFPWIICVRASSFW